MPKLTLTTLLPMMGRQLAVISVVVIVLGLIAVGCSTAEAIPDNDPFSYSHGDIFSCTNINASTSTNSDSDCEGRIAVSDTYTGACTDSQSDCSRWGVSN